MYVYLHLTENGVLVFAFVGKGYLASTLQLSNTEDELKS